MAKSNIDLFPFLKQLEANISPRYSQDTVTILAAYVYGSWRVADQDSYSCAKGDKGRHLTSRLCWGRAAGSLCWNEGDV